MSDEAKAIVSPSTLARLKGAEAWKARALPVLREVEWAAHIDDDRVCPVCDNYKPRHAPGCELAALLEEG